MPRVVPVTPEVFVRVLKSFGLVPVRQVGKMLPAFIILNDLRTAGISRNEYLERLNAL